MPEKKTCWQRYTQKKFRGPDTKPLYVSTTQAQMFGDGWNSKPRKKATNLFVSNNKKRMVGMK